MPPSPLARPANEADSSAAPKSRSSNLLEQGWQLLTELLFDRRYFWHLTSLLLLGELVLGLLIIKYVPCKLGPSFHIKISRTRDALKPSRSGVELKVADTKIDWEAYMQHVECFLKGESDYSRLQGETGPAV